MTDADDLPDGWAWTTLGEIGIWSGGGTPFKGNTAFWTGGSVPWVSPKDMKRPHIAESEDHVTTHAVETGEAKLLEPGSVLVVVRSGILQRTLPIAVTTARVTINQDLKALQPHAFVLPEFVASYLRCETQEILANCCKSGTTVANIELPRFWAFRFPLPPLAEQRRIVAKVEELMARSRAARAALAEVPTLLEQFRQSVLASAFRGDLTADWRAKNPTAEPAAVLLDRIRADRRKQWETKYPKKKYAEPELVDDSDLPELPEGWCWATLPELSSATDTLCYGVVQPGESTESGVDLIRVCDIRDGEVNTSALRKISPEIDRDYSRSRVQGGELLITVVGTIGRLAVVPAVLRGANIARAVAKLVPCSPISATWFAHWFSTPHMQDWLGREACEVARKTLNLKELERAVVPLAPLAELNELIRLLSGLLELPRRLAAEVSAALTDLDALDQSNLAKAFRGELVPQDPADEPAAALLARIRSGVSATRSVDRGRVKFYILLLLRTWNKPLSREMLERGLVLMLNADVRRAILGRSKPAPKRGKKPATPPRFVAGLDVFLGEMLDDGDLMPGPEAGFFAEGQHGIDFAAAPKADLDAVRETAEAMKVIHKDKLQATDADIVSALHGEIYELVS